MIAPYTSTVQIAQHHIRDCGYCSAYSSYRHSSVLSRLGAALSVPLRRWGSVWGERHTCNSVPARASHRSAPGHPRCTSAALHGGLGVQHRMHTPSTHAVTPPEVSKTARARVPEPAAPPLSQQICHPFSFASYTFLFHNSATALQRLFALHFLCQRVSLAFLISTLLCTTQQCARFEAGILPLPLCLQCPSPSAASLLYLTLDARLLMLLIHPSFFASRSEQIFLSRTSLWGC